MDDKEYSWIYLSNEGGIHLERLGSRQGIGWIYLSNEGGIHQPTKKYRIMRSWIYLSNEGGIHLFVGIQLSHLYLRYLPSE